MLVQLAQERQQMMREKLDMESVAKKLKEEENIFHVKRMKVSYGKMYVAKLCKISCIEYFSLSKLSEKHMQFI